MKTKAICSFFVLFAIASVTATTAPGAFADHSEVTIGAVEGSGFSQDCVADGCYTPSIATVDVGGKVIMTNTDETSIHTFTAGTVDGFAPVPSDVFDSGILNAGESFEWSPDAVGEVPYYCMLHTWMVGSIIVQEVEELPTATLVVEAPSEEETTVTGMSSDGKMRVEITASNPSAGEPMTIDLKFRNSSGAGLAEHANYDIVVTQDGIEILSMMSVHEHNGEAIYTTSQLTSDNAVDIKVTLLGFGLPDDEANWTGPTGEIIYFNVVPEFGTIAIMILAVTILSMIVLSARSRLSIIPRL